MHMCVYVCVYASHAYEATKILKLRGNDIAARSTNSLRNSFIFHFDRKEEQLSFAESTTLPDFRFYIIEWAVRNSEVYDILFRRIMRISKKSGNYSK